ncbi:hypothetical protein [Laspinema olomoucense]|uniref:hypothetical protein n=1 Tax=Laspinema olomoucense TaxID=3231600 RepID=UPI0021BB28A7|nr:hypothetical protein [Laspinema sp. D3c]MCT7996544.1 hypothetical protein [Laspinema sp. D3c]
MNTELRGFAIASGEGESPGVEPNRPSSDSPVQSLGRLQAIARLSCPRRQSLQNQQPVEQSRAFHCRIDLHLTHLGFMGWFHKVIAILRCC